MEGPRQGNGEEKSSISKTPGGDKRASVCRGHSEKVFIYFNYLLRGGRGNLKA